MSKDKKPEWDIEWQTFDIPFGHPHVENEKTYQSEKKIAKAKRKQLKRQKRQAFKAKMISIFSIVILMLVVVAVVAYNVVNDVQFIGPDFTQLTDRTGH